MINNKACEISIDLDYPIQIASGSGEVVDAKEVLFRKPNRQTGPIFQNLVAMFNRAMNKQMMDHYQLKLLFRLLIHWYGKKNHPLKHHIVF